MEKYISTSVLLSHCKDVVQANVVRRKHGRDGSNVDIKFDLTGEALSVLSGTKHGVPEKMTFSSVVSHDSTKISLTHAALNELNIFVTDTQNVYLLARTMLLPITGVITRSVRTTSKDCAYT